MIDDTDRALILATQAGLPVVAEPYQQLAQQLNISTEAVMQRLQMLLANGQIRRIGAVPNHYALGYHGNGMSVWDIDEAKVDHYGQLIGQLPFVSHAYRRPRIAPHWPYNLFAMVHGQDRAAVFTHIQTMVALVGTDCRDYEVLFSTRILKKTGLRFLGKGKIDV